MGIHVSVSGHPRKLHNTCIHIHQNPKSRSSRTSIVYTFSSIQRVAVSLFVFISTQTNVYTHRGNIKERPELPPPADDPPAAPVRRGTYCFAYALSLAIALFSTDPSCFGFFMLRLAFQKWVFLHTCGCDRAAVDTEKCWVTVAKVRTFAASKCVHNLPQTSNSIGKLIATK